MLIGVSLLIIQFCFGEERTREAALELLWQIHIFGSYFARFAGHVHFYLYMSA